MRDVETWVLMAVGIILAGAIGAVAGFWVGLCGAGLVMAVGIPVLVMEDRQRDEQRRKVNEARRELGRLIEEVNEARRELDRKLKDVQLRLKDVSRRQTCQNDERPTPGRVGPCQTSSSK